MKSSWIQKSIYSTLALLALAISGASWAQVSALGSGAANTAQNNNSLAFSVPAGTNRVLIVAVETIGNPSAVSFAGNNLSEIGAQDAGVGIRGELWGVALGSGDAINGTIVASGFNTTNSWNVVAAQAFQGVDQASPWDGFTSATTGGGNGSSSIIVTSAADDLVFDAIVAQGNGGAMSATVGAGQTQSFNSTTGNGLGAGSYEAGAASVTMSWDFVNFFAGSHMGVNLNAAAPGNDIAITVVENTADPVIAGSGPDNLNITFTVTNNGPEDATGLTAQFSAVTVGGSIISNPPCTYTPSQGTITYPDWNIGSLANGSSVTVTESCNITSDSDAGAERTFTLEVTAVDLPDPDPSNDSATEVTTIAREVDILVEKTTATPTKIAGVAGDVVHTATVTNTGPSAVTGASFCDVPTLDLTDITIVNNPPVVSDGNIGALGSCAGGWLWDNLDLGVNESATLTLTLTVGPGAIEQTITNTIDFVSSTGGETETGPEPNTASADTEVERLSDLSIVKTDGGVANVVAGTQLTYTFNYANAGPSDAANVTVVDDLPTGFTHASNTAPGGCTPDAPAAGFITCDLGTVAAGAASSFDVTVDVASDVPNGTLAVNEAVISSDSNDPDEINNTSQEATEVIAVADLSIVKTADPEPVGLGAQLTYSFEVDNNGPSDAQDVVTTDDLPPAFEGQVDVTSLPGACSIVLEDVVCDWGTLPAGFNTTYTFVVDVPSDETVLGFHENAVVITTSTTDPDEANNVSDVITQVVAGTAAEGTAILVIQKFFVDFNNETPVTLNLQCTNGQPNQSSVTVFPDDPFQQGAIFGMYEVAFVIDNIALVNDEGASCTVTEEPVAGYGTAYYCDQAWSMSTVGDTCGDADDVFDDFYNPQGEDWTACSWTDVQEGDSNFCYIPNYVLPVDVSVTKEWDITNMGGDFFDRGVNVTIWCSSPILNGTETFGSWYRSFWLPDSAFVDGEETVTAQVIPNFERTDPTVAATYCWATEDIDDSSVEIESDCGDISDPGMVVSAGNGDSCTITNTVFFEGIPTLSQWGMAIMALLMLGIGMVGFRRFA